MTTISRLRAVQGKNAIKVAARVATTANITLSGLQTIDGIALATDDRVLVKDQTTASENGLYSASDGTWTRTIDLNDNYDVVAGFVVVILEGTTQAQTGWILTTTSPNIGTSDLDFEAWGFPASAIVAAGSALTITGQWDFSTLPQLDGTPMTAFMASIMDASTAGVLRADIEAMFHEQTVYTGDLEALTDTGFYAINGTTTNAWGGQGDGAFVLNIYHDGNTQQQVGYDDEGGVWRRKKISGTWGSWFSLTNDTFAARQGSRPRALFHHETTQNTNSGELGNATWATLVFDVIDWDWATDLSLASSQFTIASAGAEYFLDAAFPIKNTSGATRTGAFRVRNVTQGTTLLQGGQFSLDAGDSQTVFLKGPVAGTDASDVLEIQGYASGTGVLSPAANLGTERHWYAGFTEHHFPATTWP